MSPVIGKGFREAYQRRDISTGLSFHYVSNQQCPLGYLFSNGDLRLHNFWKPTPIYLPRLIS